MGLAQGIVIVAQFLLLVTQAPWEASARRTLLCGFGKEGEWLCPEAPPPSQIVVVPAPSTQPTQVLAAPTPAPVIPQAAPQAAAPVIAYAQAISLNPPAGPAQGPTQTLSQATPAPAPAPARAPIIIAISAPPPEKCTHHPWVCKKLELTGFKGFSG